ncbi:MAG: energy-coupling factor transporter transmembrane component T, partial [Rhodoglobus sp.]
MSTFYLDRPSPLHRLNPVTKLVGVLSVLLVVFALPQWWASVTILVLVVVPVAAFSSVGGRLLVIGSVLVGPLILVLVIAQGFFYPGRDTILFEWGPFQFSLEGLLLAIAIGARTAVLVTATLLLLLTTHPGALLTALTERGMPPKISYVISSTLQIIPAFRTRAESILLAQRSRGLRTKGSIFRRVAVLLPLITPLVLGVFVDVEERSTAMEARAFGSTRSRVSYSVIPDSRPQRVARWVLIIVAAALVVLAFT